MSETVVISHSEVESFLSCQMKHYYAFIDSTFGPLAGLEPKSFSDALFRGIQGHDALMVFYQAIKDGHSVDDAAEESYQRLRVFSVRPEVLMNPAHLKITQDLQTRILPRYYAKEAVDLIRQGWKPIHVEETFRLRMEFENGTFVYPFKPDVIMADQAGNLWVWDHKFVYNFYSPTEINLLPQIPKYIGALRASTDLYIKGGYYNQLRHREVKDVDNHVKHVPVKPSDTRVKNAFRQQYKIMVEIAERKTMGADAARDAATRVLSTMVCKSCSFKDLCVSDLNGENTELAKRVNFKANSYGYTESAE